MIYVFFYNEFAFIHLFYVCPKCEHYPAIIWMGENAATQKSISNLVKHLSYYWGALNTLFISLIMENIGDGSKSTPCILDHQLSSKQNAANGYVAYLQCYSVQLLNKAHCRLHYSLPNKQATSDMSQIMKRHRTCVKHQCRWWAREQDTH